jgi:aspartyl-tRNA(Asn)/glutamyl-tRNA(Gln) amidotransferase subunit C
VKSISREEVERVASLARLSLSDAEIARIGSELTAILGYVETLERVDTRDVPPTSHVIALATPLREDVAEPPLDPELALLNAPQRSGSSFVVPKVIEGEDEEEG